MSRVTEGPTNISAANGGAPGNAAAGAGGATGAGPVRDSLVGKIVCPFCGQQKSASSEPCPRCTMEDTPATRQATKARIGPWYVLQNRSPSAPGMKYATLLWLVNKGHVTPRSVVRGPTTYQLWRYAAHVRGLSREFGLCYSCGGAVQKSDHVCPQCERPQDPPLDPDVLLDVRDGAGQLRAPVMREIDPRDVREPRDFREPRDARDARERDMRAATEARRTPPPPPPVREEAEVDEYDADDDDDDADERRDDEDSLESTPAEPSHSERLRAANEMIVHPKPRQELARRPGGGRMVSATHLAAALQDPEDAPAPRARRWGALNVVLFLILLLGGAGAALLYLKPEYRAPTAQWAGRTWDAIRNKLASMQWSSPPGEPPAPAPTRVASKPPPPSSQPHSVPAVQVAKSDAPPRVEPKIELKVEPKTEQPQPQLARDTTAPPTPTTRESQQPSKDQGQPTQPQRKPDDRTAAAARTTETPDARAKQPPQQPPQQAQPNTSETPTLDQALDDSRKLYRQGIDAEARNDYAAALSFYEQIKKLRREAWPGDLQIRIDLAREEIKSKSAKSD